MKTWKRLICCVMCLMMVCALAVSLAPVEANAAGTNKVSVCAALDSNGEIVNADPGVPIATDSGMLIYTAKGLYDGTGHIYAVAVASGTPEMTYIASGCGFDMFSFSGKASDCYTAAKAEVGATVTLYGLHEDGQVTGSAKILGYDATPNSENFYELKLDITSSTKFWEPIALVNSEGKLVAIGNSEGVFAFVEPAGSTGGGAAPTEAAPAPTEAAPAPTEAAPAPTEAAAAPTEATEAAGGETGPSRGTEPKEEPEPKPGSNTVLIIGIAAAVVIVVVIVLLVMKKKKTPENSNHEEISETVAVPPAKNNNGGNWEDVSRSAGISIYLAGMDGALAGREYRISQQGVLIGRAEEANIRYPADTKGVSRRHCKVFWNNGVLMVMDLGSTSGTYLRGKGQLPPNAPVAVVEGDVIYLGSKQNALVLRTK